MNKIKDMESELDIITKFRDIDSINLDEETLKEAKELAKSVPTVDALTRNEIDKRLLQLRIIAIDRLRRFIFENKVNTEKLSWTVKEIMDLTDKNIVDGVFTSKFGFPEILLLNNEIGSSKREPYIVTEDYMIISEKSISVPKLEVMENSNVITTASHGIRIRK